MKTIYYFFLCALITVLASCREDLEITNKSLDFTISNDSIFIDNVFAGTKSPIYSLSLKNNSNKDIIIPSISLAQKQSKVTLNIHGKSGQIFNNVPLFKNDSLRILLQVVAERDLNSQYYEDGIIFSNQQNESKKVTILSFLEKSKIYFSSSDLVYSNKVATLDNTKTHIFYKDLIIPENSTLNIEPGTQLRFFKNASIKLNSGSILNANGSPKNHIILKGFRNEPRFDSLPGQWKGIESNQGKINLNATLIKGAKTGISALKSNLKINQSYIQTSSEYGIYAIESSLNLINSVIYNAGETTLWVQSPLESNVIFSTIANPWSSNVVGILGQKLPFEIKDFKNKSFNVFNSIFYGDSPNGIKIPDGDLTNLKFENNLIKNNNSEILNLKLPIFSNIITSDPLFESSSFSKPNLKLKENSPAKNKGKYLNFILKDINNQARVNPPNLGAYK